MKCPNLDYIGPVCHTFDEGYTPSPFQFEEYCSTEAYKRCPFYLSLNRKVLFDRKTDLFERLR
jgi:hypothetical protein